MAGRGSALAYIVLAAFVAGQAWTARINREHLRGPNRSMDDGLYSQRSALSQIWKEAIGKDVVFTLVQSNVAAGMPSFKYWTVLHETDQQQLVQQGILEPFVSYHLTVDMQACCKGGGHFLDIGGNFGWFALLGAATGCSVETVEPVPWFSALIEHQKLLNPSLATKINVRKGVALGSQNGKIVDMKVPTSGLMGAAGIDGLNAGNLPTVSVRVPMQTVDALGLPAGSSSRPWCGMKVDVEGFEPDVFEGAAGFMLNRPQIIVIELSPGMTKWKDPSNSKLFRMLKTIKDAGYTPHLLLWDVIKTHDMQKADDSMSPYIQTDSNMIISMCGFNCMVYFRRQW